MARSKDWVKAYKEKYGDNVFELMGAKGGKAPHTSRGFSDPSVASRAGKQSAKNRLADKST